MKKRLFALLMVMLIAFTFIGCQSQQADKDTKSTDVPKKEAAGNEDSKDEEPVVSNFNETGYPIVNEPITLTLMGKKAAIQGEWADLVMFKEAEKLTNIKIDITTYPAESFQELKNVALVSGTYTDLLYGCDLSTSDEVSYGAQGVFIPLNDLIDSYATNMLALMAEDSQLRPNITTTDGNIYSLPFINHVPWGIANKFWINQEWIKNVGKEMPVTTDDLYELLLAFKNEDANGNGDTTDEIPFSFYGNLPSCFLANFGMLNREIYSDPETTEIKFAPITDNYKAYLTFMNKLWTEGLLDSEGYSQTSQQMTAKGDEYRIGLFSHAASFLTVTDYEKADDYPALPPLTSKVHDTKIWPKNNQLNRGQFAITDKNEYPAASIRWIDYFYGYEGGVMMSQGPEDLAWEWREDGFWQKILPEGFATTEEYRGGVITPNCGTSTPGVMPAEYYAKMNYPFPMMPAEVVDKYVDYVYAPYPLVYFTDEDQKRIDVLSTDITTYVTTKEAEFITGILSIDEFDGFVAELEKMGVKEYIDIYQSAYDAWSAGQ